MPELRAFNLTCERRQVSALKSLMLGAHPEIPVDLLQGLTSMFINRRSSPIQSNLHFFLVGIMSWIPNAKVIALTCWDASQEKWKILKGRTNQFRESLFS